MGVTINDVAKRAGVSHTTVSWVIHNDKRITQKTRDKVLAAIKELNYHPNYLARSLVQGKTNTIALVASQFSSAFEIEILKGIEKNFSKMDSNYSLNQYTTYNEHTKIKETFEQILFGKRADAVISMSVIPPAELVKEFQLRKVPLIVIEDSLDGVSVVKSDNETGAFLATEHLIKRGYKKIGMIVEDCYNEYTGLSPRERLAGFKRALKEYDMPFSDDLLITIEDYYFEEGAEALSKILDRGMDAVFSAAGDMVAMGVIDAAKKKGVKIPEDLGIVGYDDLLISSIVTPSLTTVAQPIQEMGERSLEMAIHAMENGMGQEECIVYTPELKIRESS